MKLSIGFSPCPNDTFIFDALINKKIDTGNIEFDLVLEDVQTLNRYAKEGRLDLSKLSYPAFFESEENYILLDAGSAMGRGVGPLLIAAGKEEDPFPNPQNASVALPGETTTAHLLFNFAYPDAKNKKFMLFSEIEEQVLQGKSELGVIIHENRFTYAEKGLRKLIDLGEYWEEKMQSPIPLGAIAAKRSLPKSTSSEVNSLIRKSLEYAFSQYPQLPEFVIQHSQEMSEEVMRNHINLYVNDFSLSIGKEGREAVRLLYSTYLQMTGSNSKTRNNQLFLESD